MLSPTLGKYWCLIARMRPSSELEYRKCVNCIIDECKTSYPDYGDRLGTEQEDDLVDNSFYEYIDTRRRVPQSLLLIIKYEVNSLSFYVFESRAIGDEKEIFSFNQEMFQKHSGVYFNKFYSQMCKKIKVQNQFSYKTTYFMQDKVVGELRESETALLNNNLEYSYT